MLLAMHFDYSSIYREHRNNFDQKLQNKSEKLIKTFVSASHLSDEFVWVASYVCRKLFSSGFYRENLAFFPLKSTFEFLFHRAKVRMNFFSRPSMDQTGFSSAPASIGL